MEQLRRVLEFIRQNLRGLDASKKLLIASLCVIMVMTLFLVSQYAGRRSFVALMPGMPADEQMIVAAQLKAANIRHEIGDGGVVMVASAQHDEIFAQLGQNGQLPQNTELLFSNLIENQSWTNSRTQNDQLFAIALQNELSARIADWPVIRSATVVIDAPEPRGVGAAVRRPTAAVTAMGADGGALSQGVVDAISQYVAGAKAGLEPENVKVIDASTGRARQARGADGIDASSYLEATQAIERQWRDKIYDLVSDIPGVIVQVTAEVDVTRRTRNEQRMLAKDDGSVSFVKSESAKAIETTGASNAGEPGFRSNTGADIQRSGGGRTGSTETDDRTEFETLVGRPPEQIVDPRGHPTRLVATIAVPRAYVIALMGATASPDDAPAPTPEEIDQFWDLEKERIKERVDPHLQTTGPDGVVAPGSVVVSMVGGQPEAIAGAPGAGPGAGGGGGGMTGMLGLGGDLVDKAILVSLSGVALAMMLLMVKRSSRKLKLPTAEELVGIPPSLGAGEDIVGEAEESDSPLAGLEVGEEQLRSQKLLEQVGALINENPELAGGMLGRWVAAED